jgi:benzoyl-CoA reductase subunit C
MTRPTDLLALAAQLHNPHLDRFIAEGGKVVGHGCLATPRELFDAAGLFPLRIRALGSPRRELADARMARFNCSFCRSCLQLALDGTYDFLDGLVETNGCDHLRGMFENWQHSRPRAFFHYLRVPHLINPTTLEVFTDELTRLRAALAQHYEVEISDARLRQVYAVQNRIQGKLMQLRALRELERPGLSGTEAIAVALLESAMPPPEFEALVDALLQERASGPTTAAPEPRARLFLSGAATDELTLVGELERGGCLFVGDALCYSSRTVRAPLDLEREPMEALAAVYLNDLLCPRMFDDYASRQENILETIRRGGAEGVILIHNQFCDLHGVENTRLRIDLERKGIPALVLEKEYGAASDLGRIKTRVQAFLERIGK